jgi:hypothetical protein
MCAKAGLDFHFFDAEWPHHYLDQDELENLLSFQEELESDLTTIITINARHTAATKVLSEFIQAAHQHKNVGLCVVAGNPSYLTEEERTLDASSRIIELVRATRNELPSTPIFVGSEGLEDVASQLATDYSTVPFMLLSRAVDEHATRLSHNGNGSAVYCPSDLSNRTEEELINSFGQYALRRQWVRAALVSEGHDLAEIQAALSSGGLNHDGAKKVLADAIRDLTLCGNRDATERLRDLSRSGIRYATFLLTNESREQYSRLSNLVVEVNANQPDESATFDRWVL